MIIQIPDTFPSHLYHWVAAKRVKTKDGILKMTFENKEQYEETLDHPWKLAQSAIDDGCNEILLYVKGSSKAKVGLNAESVLGLGRKIGAID